MTSALKKDFKGKTILVTGGAGSIGSVLVKRLLKYEPYSIRVFDINEGALFELEQQLKGQENNIRLFIGDVRDKERLNKALEDVDIVFHAAALKHVYLNEYNPFEAIKTNVMGTQNVIDACLANNVKKMIYVSTDKVVNPLGVMGATKLLGEKLTIAANFHKGAKNTIFSAVRFGNVLGSRGSVIPLFKNQIAKGGPITITDPEMTRFIMSIEKAVDLILYATEKARGGEIFVLKMDAVKIRDLAEAAIENFSALFNQNPKKIQIKIIGKKPGEKFCEELITDEERERCSPINNELVAVYPSLKAKSGFEAQNSNGNSKNALPKEFCFTSKSRTLNHEEISKIIRNDSTLFCK